jgi:hypothetical protein
MYTFLRIGIAEPFPKNEVKETDFTLGFVRIFVEVVLVDFIQYELR